MKNIPPTGICHNPWQSAPIGASTGASSFSGFHVLSKAVSWRCGQKRRPPCPAPQFPWGPTWFCRTTSNRATGFALPASQLGDVHQVLLCLCRYHKALCRSSLNSMKAMSCSLIGAKYPFSHFFCWFGVEAPWKRISTVLLALLKWGHRHINNRKDMLLKRMPAPISRPTFK